MCSYTSNKRLFFKWINADLFDSVLLLKHIFLNLLEIGHVLLKKIYCEVLKNLNKLS